MSNKINLTPTVLGDALPWLLRDDLSSPALS